MKKRKPPIIDTLKYSQTLRNADVPEKQANGHTIAMQGAMSTLLEQVATKEDMNELRVATKEDMNELRVATKEDMNELRSDMHEFKVEIKEEMNRRFLAVDKRFLEVERKIWQSQFFTVGVLASLMTVFHFY